MVSLAHAVFELVLPTEKEGVRSLLKAQREDTEFRKLFERAVGNFFAAELPRGRRMGCLSWQEIILADRRRITGSPYVPSDDGDGHYLGERTGRSADYH